MPAPLLRAVPVFALIGAGMLLRRAGVLDRPFGQALMRLVFYLLLPALLFVTLAEAALDVTLLRVMLAGIAALAGSLLAGRLVSGALRLPKPSQGTLLAASGIMMGAFQFGVLELVWAPLGQGEAALTRGITVDLANAVLSVTVIQYIAARHGAREAGARGAFAGMGSLISAPLLWATLGGAGLNLAGGPERLPAPLWESVRLASQATIPCILIGVGLFLQLDRQIGRVPILGAACRVLAGLAAGYLAATALGLDGLDRAAVLIMAAAPCGSSSLVFSALYELDAPLAARLISVSVLLSLVTVSVLISF